MLISMRRNGRDLWHRVEHDRSERRKWFSHGFVLEILLLLLEESLLRLFFFLLRVAYCFPVLTWKKGCEWRGSWNRIRSEGTALIKPPHLILRYFFSVPAAYAIHPERDVGPWSGYSGSCAGRQYAWLFGFFLAYSACGNEPDSCRRSSCPPERDSWRGVVLSSWATPRNPRTALRRRNVSCGSIGVSSPRRCRIRVASCLIFLACFISRLTLFQKIIHKVATNCLVQAIMTADNFQSNRTEIALSFFRCLKGSIPKKSVQFTKAYKP